MSAVHSTRSSRDSGNSRPLGVPPTECPERPTRCRKAAIARGEASWHTRSTSPMSMPSSSEAVATSARSRPLLRALLGVQARLLGHAAVVRGDVLLADALGQVPRQALGLAARVDEHQRRAVLAHELRQAVVDLRPHLARHHRLQRRGRDLQLQVARAHVTDIHDGAVRRAIGAQVARADEEARHIVDGFLGGGQPDAAQAAAGEGLQALERVSARCAPRLLPATAWISSTITVRVVASICRPDCEPMRM